MLGIQRDRFEKLLNETEEIKRFYDDEISEIKSIIDYIDNNDISINKDDNIDTIILKRYIEYGNMKRVQEYLDSMGYRLKTNSYVGNRKYTLEDISQTVYPYEKRDEKPREVNADEELKEIVKKIHIRIFSSKYGRLKPAEYFKKKQPGNEHQENIY